MRLSRRKTVLEHFENKILRIEKYLERFSLIKSYAFLVSVHVLFYQQRQMEGLYVVLSQLRFM